MDIVRHIITETINSRAYGYVFLKMHIAPIICLASTSWKSCEPDIAAKKYDYNESNMIKLKTHSQIS